MTADDLRAELARLTEPMTLMLDAARVLGLVRPYPAERSTVAALVRRGLLSGPRDGAYILTDAGRVASFKIYPDTKQHDPT